MQAQIDESKAQYDKKQKECQGYSNDVQDLQRKQLLMNTDLRKYKDENKKLVEENKKMIAELESYKKKMAIYDDIEIKEQSLKTLDAVETKFRNYAWFSKSHQEFPEIPSTDKDKDKNLSKKEFAAKKAKRTIDFFDSIETQINDLNNDLETYRKENHGFRKENKKLENTKKDEVDSLTAKNKKLSEKCKNFEEKHNETQKKLKEVERERTQLNKKLQQQHDKFQPTKMENDRLTLKAEENQKQIAKFEAENEFQKKKIEQLDIEIKSYMESQERYKKRNEHLTEENQEMRSKFEEYGVDPGSFLKQNNNNTSGQNKNRGQNPYQLIANVESAAMKRKTSFNEADSDQAQFLCIVW